MKYTNLFLNVAAMLVVSPTISISNCCLYATNGYGLQPSAGSITMTISDTVLSMGISVAYTATNIILSNVLINNSIGIGNAGGITYTDVQFKNVFISDGFTLTMFATCLTAFNSVYVNGTSTVLNISGMILKYAGYNQQWISLYQSLVSSYLLTAANYTAASIVPTYTRKSIRGYLGTIKRNYYQLSFSPQNTIADTLKYNDDNDLILWYRDDIEADLTTALIAKIKNSIFFKSDGTTAVTSYRDSESFLIIAERDSVAGTYGIFGYHKGQILPTIYSEIWNAETYTIKRVFNILEFPEEASYTNLYNISNSPIEASYLMQDITSKVVK